MDIEVRIRKLEKLSNIIIKALLVVFLLLLLLLLLIFIYIESKEKAQFLAYMLMIDLLLFISLVSIWEMFEDPLQFVEFFKKIGADIVYISKKGVIAYLDNFIIIGMIGLYLGLVITKAIAPRIAEKRKVEFPFFFFLRTKEMKVDGVKVMIKCGRFIVPHKEHGYIDFRSKYVFVHAYKF